MGDPIVKADVLALPKLAAKLPSTVMGDLAWVDLLAVVNKYDLSQIDDDELERQARIYLAAHLALTEVQAASGAAGPVTSRAAGQVRTSFGLLAQAAGTNNFAGTQYGSALLAILSISQARGPMLI